MTVNPKTLIDVINRNKGKTLTASKIVEKNPKSLSVVSKMIQDERTKPDLSKERMQVNRSMLEEIHNSIVAVKNNNKNIIKLFPDIEMGIQILVSSILSPKKMTDTQLNYSLKKKFTINPTVSSEILEIIKNYFNDEYELEDKLPEIIREALFTSGAFVYSIIPEASVDELINSDIFASYSVENFKEKISKVTTKLVSPINIKPPVIETITDYANYPDNVKKESAFVKTLSEQLISGSLLNITDNPGILNFGKMKDKVKESLIKNSIRSNTSVSAEALEKIEYMDIFRQRNASYSSSNIEFVKSKKETSRKSIGKPLLMKIATESIIPAFIPGNETEHIAYLVLLDETGKPLSTDSSGNAINNISSQGTLGPSSQFSPIQKAYSNLMSDNTSNINVNSLFEMYKNILEKQLYDTVRNSLYGTNMEIASKNDIYFLMFTRALANQKTNVLFIPKEMVVYFAFKYNSLGIGKTLLEDTTTLSSLRAILLFARVMAQAKSAIDVTNVNIALDPRDPDPEKSIAIVQESVLKLRENFLPVGINDPDMVASWIQRAGLRFTYTNNPDIPDVKVDFENSNLQHAVPDGAVDEDLRRQSILTLGLSPETVDSGFNTEFAVTQVNNNVLLNKRIKIYQKALSKHLVKFHEIFIYNDEELRSRLRTHILSSINSLSDTLSETEKSLLASDKTAFIEYYIDQISENIQVDLPKPDSTNLSNLAAEYEVYKNGLIEAMDTIISTEMFSKDIAGTLSEHIDTVKNIYINHLLRQWMAANSYYPEVLDISSSITQDIDGMLSVITDHLSHTMRNSSKLVLLLQKFKDAVDKDLSEVSGEGGEEITSNSSTSSDSSSSEGDMFGSFGSKEDGDAGTEDEDKEPGDDFNFNL